MYGLAESENLYAHQLWAACTLYQATGKATHWKTTESIYAKWIRNKEDNDRAADTQRVRGTCTLSELQVKWSRGFACMAVAVGAGCMQHFLLNS